jgi:O-acetylhomoserine/O-acetylserine sulfhydrylase-like pyridoxal-dependent enzyme
MLATQPFLSVDAEPGPMNVVVTARCYGGTFQLFAQDYAIERGVEVRWVQDPLDLAEWERKIDGRTRLVLGEMPSNPQLSVFDIAGVARLAHAVGAPLIVDSTIATPALLRPIEHGADIVVHSLSKAIGGSGLVIAGAVVARKPIVSRIGPDALREDFAMYAKTIPHRNEGPALNALSALLLMSDLRTLRPRVDQWSRTALTVARYLERHAIASRYLRLVDGDADGREANRYGHLMGFRVKGGPRAARRVFDGLEMIWRATDLGKAKSVATIPMISTHQQQGDEGRDLAAIPGDLIRLSTGGEHPDDLIADLDRALAKA